MLSEGYCHDDYAVNLDQVKEDQVHNSKNANEADDTVTAKPLPSTRLRRVTCWNCCKNMTQMIGFVVPDAIKDQHSLGSP